MKLLDFTRFRPVRASVATAVPQFHGPAQMRAYWEALRTGGGIPDRAQLDPRGLGGVLDRVFLAEGIGLGLVQVRIAGSALTQAAGMDLRGLPLSCLFAPEARPALAEALAPVIDGTALVELDLGNSAGRAAARLLLLPLRDGADRRLVLGCLGHDPAILTARTRFEILRRQDERIAPPPPATIPHPARPVRHLTLVHARP